MMFTRGPKMTDSNDQSDIDDTMKKSDTHWERGVLEKLAFAAINEQRRTRRWGIFFKSLLVIYLIGVAGIAMAPFGSKGPLKTGNGHTALVDVRGVISEATPTNASAIIKGLTAAFNDENTKGIILRMNTPGGSPVQSDYVYHEIRRLKAERPDLPIYAVVSDVCASGGYYIASAADKIFVNPSSLIGSIGVIMNGFGFVTAMEKLGVERRLMIAGEHKALLDPFSDVSSEEKNHVQELLTRVHEQFITAVREGRGDRLKNNPDLFSGLIWTGAQSIEMGLADSVGNTRSVAKDVIGAEELVDFTPQEKLFDRLASQVGVMVGRVVTELTSVRMGY